MRAPASLPPPRPRRPHDAPDDDRVRELCETGTLAEVDAALALLINEKLKIQAQLSDSKAQMMSVRSDLISRGADGRLAQIEATASVDNQWRGRATRAAMAMDRKIARLNARRRVLVTAPAGAGASSPQTRRRIAVTASSRSLEELGSFVQSWIDDGWAVVQSIEHPDGHVLVMADQVKKEGV